MTLVAVIHNYTMDSVRYQSFEAEDFRNGQEIAEGFCIKDEDLFDVLSEAEYEQFYEPKDTKDII